jgi:hypothetical protein
MGCSTSKPDRQQYQQAFAASKESGFPVYSGVSRDMDLLCRDEFSSMYSGETMYRWRPADCKVVEGRRHNLIYVHYTGWSESFDHWVDLDCEAGRVCPPGLLPKEQTKEGGPLDAQQAAQAMNFFLHGSMDNLTCLNDTSPKIHYVDSIIYLSSFHRRVTVESIQIGQRRMMRQPPP